MFSFSHQPRAHEALVDRPPFNLNLHRHVEHLQKSNTCARSKGRPSTSGGARHKGRPPSNNHSNKFYSPPATADGERPSTAVGGQDRGGGSVVSAFTTRTEYTKTNGGGGGGRDGMLMGFEDDPSGAPSLPYYATTLTISRPSTPHEGSVRLLT